MAEETKHLTSEQKAALRERVARLKSPEEIAEQMAELCEAVVEIIVTGQRLLGSKTAKCLSDDARYS